MNGAVSIGLKENGMSEFLATAYPWIKALHIVSVIAWMAGLFYLPRLFVYHRERADLGSETQALFTLMERRLLKVVTTPAMLSSWIFGLLLISIPGVFDWTQAWPWIKIAAVLIMTGFHFWLAKKWKELESGSCSTTGKQFRYMNEVPAILVIVIVLMVVARPF